MTAPRSSRRDPLFVMALGLSALSIPWAWHQIHLDLGILWSARRRARWSKVAGDLFSPHLGPRGWRGLIDAASDTFAMSLIAIVISVVLGLTLAAIAARAPTQFANRDPLSRFRHIVGWVGRGLVRVSLLLTRAVPPSIWAFVVLLVMFPGVWPGAIALGVYNAGVLGRLFLETFEDANAKVQASLINVGAQRGASLWYSVLPLSASRIAALALYRWEVVVRETVIVGVVGAAGLGRLVQEDLVARDLGAVSSSIIAIAFLSMIVSRVGSVTRRLLR